MFEYLKLFYFLLRPKTIFVRRISGALGDNILLTVLLPGLKRKYPDHKIVVETPIPELFLNNPHVDWITRKHFKTTGKFIKPKYRVIGKNGEPFISQIQKYIGSEDHALPELYLTADEINRARAGLNFPCIAVAPAGKTKFSANRNIWGIGNFQSVRDHYPDIQFVQIGLSSEPLLENVMDARSRSLRDTAAILKNSMFFLGHQGGFMHLSKAVGKTSVLLFGGYIRPDIVGYKDDINLYSDVDCSPCYTSEEKQTDCPSMKCMKMITVETVIAAVGDMLEKTGNMRNAHED